MITHLMYRPTFLVLGRVDIQATEGGTIDEEEGEGLQGLQKKGVGRTGKQMKSMLREEREGVGEGSKGRGWGGKQWEGEGKVH